MKMTNGIVEGLYNSWLPIWELILGLIEPLLPEYLHWNELCVSIYNSILFFKAISLMIQLCQEN